MTNRKSKLPIQRRRTGDETVKKEMATRVRTRIRKPRYVSLTKLDRMAEDDDGEMEIKLIDLFPTRSAVAVAVVPAAEEEDVSRISEYFFTEECDSLTGLLDSEEAISVSVEVSPVFEGVERDVKKLVNAALRSRERDESEEKWVSYSEVVEDVSSSAVDGCGREEYEEEERRVMKLKRLSLKLDFQEVLDAWDWDGGQSFFVGDGDCAQIVPCFDDDELFSAGDCNAAWSVPDHKAKKMIKNEEFIGNWEEDEQKGRMGQMREASLLRYKEKRRNRLFSKRIRYEVRKLNAEKRPRIKVL